MPRTITGNGKAGRICRLFSRTRIRTVLSPRHRVALMVMLFSAEGALTVTRLLVDLAMK
jgi:hypothetical protein